MADATVANNSSQLDTVLDNNTVREDVLRFSQTVSLQGLIEVLDQLATLHPVIHGQCIFGSKDFAFTHCYWREMIAAVTVFCGVIKMYAKRQLNNKKIDFLFTEMHYMMAALTK